MVPEVGVDHGEKQRLTVLAAGRKGGDGLEPSANSDVRLRPLGAVNKKLKPECRRRDSNPHALTGRGF